MDNSDWDFAAFDDVSSVEGWQVIHPTPKALPLPSNLSRVACPRIRAPFQVADILSASSPVSRPTLPKASSVQHSSGLPRPANFESNIESLRYPNVSQHDDMAKGLPAPAFSQPTPRSCIRDDPLEEQPQDPIWQGNPVPGTKSKTQSAPKISKMLGPTQSSNASNLTRIRIASQSPVVWKLWTQSSAALREHSEVLRTDAVQCISGWTCIQTFEPICSHYISQIHDMHFAVCPALSRHAGFIVDVDRSDPGGFTGLWFISSQIRWLGSQISDNQSLALGMQISGCSTFSTCIWPFNFFIWKTKNTQRP